MRSLSAIAIVIVVAGVVPVSADEPTVSTHQQAVLELMEVMHVDRTVKDTIDLMVKAQVQASPQLAPFEDLLRDFLAKYLAWETLRDDYAQLYVESYTEKEIRKLSKFYRTELGQKLIDTLPEIMSKGAALGQSKVAAHIDELKDLVTKRAQEMELQKKQEP